ncbi:hypothetical protein IPJ72_05655 [Candidatus Peregrinibacteria bacterium]|nr:MAG: hypothetical protein IPJ72_05655 [Candidatus Peregrinibacteria bacterium]
MKNKKQYDFTPVAMFFIVAGVILFCLGLGLLFLHLGIEIDLTDAIILVVGGMLVMAVGYNNLELGLSRKELHR